MRKDLQEAHRRSETVSLAAYGAALYVASVLYTGYRIYYHNQSLQIPLVHLLNDPTLYPNDPFAATLPCYASEMWRVVAWGARVVGLEPVLAGLFLVERALLIYASARLALTFAPKSRLAAVAAMAFFALRPTPILGGGTIVMPYFEQTGFAIPFLLLAIAAFYDRRPGWWALWMGIVFNCNSMYAAYAVTYFAAAYAFDPGYRGEWRRWLAATVLLVCIASPSIWLTAGAYGKQAADDALWVAAARVRLPHHLFPMTWSMRAYVKFNAVLFLALILLWRNRSRSDLPQPLLGKEGSTLTSPLAKGGLRGVEAADGAPRSERLVRLTVLWGAVSVAWLLYGFAAEWARSPAMLVMQPARATDFWYCFAAAALIAVCACRFEEGNGTKPLLLAAAAPVIAFWPMDKYLPYLALGLIALISPPAWRYVLREGDPRRLAALATAGALLIGASAFALRIEHRGSVAAALVGRPSFAERQVAAWARSHTPKDAAFLVNPNWGEFRALSKRPVLVTWKDGSALLWYRPFATAWAQRLRELGYDVTREQPPGTRISAQLDALYAALTDPQVRALGERYRIRYWVVPAARVSRFPFVYRNRLYRVLDLRGVGGVSGTDRRARRAFPLAGRR